METAFRFLLPCPASFAFRGTDQVGDGAGHAAHGQVALLFEGMFGQRMLLPVFENLSGSPIKHGVEASGLMRARLLPTEVRSGLRLISPDAGNPDVMLVEKRL